MTVHELKCWPSVFQDMFERKKLFEYRKNDRNFLLGDVLWLKEFDPVLKTCSGREFWVDVTYIIYGGQFGIPEGYCIMGVQPAKYSKGAK